jgi:aspartyl-tRNA(Asn)/glutamyl-tRNA(Gln) amidotransferase subunit A
LRAAGAIVVGKTNTHEYAYGYTTENPHFGDTRNPWDHNRIAGGSSGGSGAAIAAGSALGALGSDTGGSIRVPASFCGIVGLKPTYGRVSRVGLSPLAWSLDHAGPMGRSVPDVAAMLEVIAGHDPVDPTSAIVPVPACPVRGDDDLSSVRIGVPAHFFEGVDAEVEALVRAALDALEELGARCVEMTLPHVDDAVDAWLTILLSEAASIHEQDIRQRPDLYGDDVRLYLEEGMLIPATLYLKAQRIRRSMTEGFRAAMGDIDLLATPATALPAPLLGEAVVDIAGNSELLFRALARISSPFDMTGLPALSVPCGFTTNGLPVGLQLVTRPFAEPLVLRVGAAYETSQEWASRRPRYEQDGTC